MTVLDLYGQDCGRTPLNVILIFFIEKKNLTREAAGVPRHLMLART